MRFTLSGALYLLGIATAAYTTVPQYRYGQWLDPAAFLVIGGFAVPYGTAASMVFLHWAKVVLVAGIVCLWRRKLRAAAAVVGAICLGLAALSIWNSMGLLALNRNERVTTSDVSAQRDADLRAEMKAIVERLALIGWRPLATVTAEIAAERRQHAWESTSECTQIKTGVDRRYRTASRSDTAKEMSATQAHEGRGPSRALADVLQATPDATPDQTAAVSRATNKKSAGRRPPVVHQIESCDACPRARQPMSRTASVGLVDERLRAVAAFVAQLPRSPSARASGSALFAAYDDLRGRDGWPPIPPNVFGALLSPAVAAAGGQKRKSNRQVYIGVGVPPM